MITMEPVTVTIPKTVYDDLKRDAFWLRCLEGAGVDNWEGYDFAIEFFRERYPEDDE